MVTGAVCTTPQFRGLRPVRGSTQVALTAFGRQANSSEELIPKKRLLTSGAIYSITIIH
jgi:hypothetical protein